MRKILPTSGFSGVKTNHFKMYLLLKNLMFHSRARFQGLFNVNINFQRRLLLVFLVVTIEGNPGRSDLPS